MKRVFVVLYTVNDRLTAQSE